MAFSRDNALTYVPATSKSNQSASTPGFSLSSGALVAPSAKTAAARAEAIRQNLNVANFTGGGGPDPSLGSGRGSVIEEPGARAAALAAGKNLFQGGPLAGGIIDGGFGRLASGQLPDASQALEQLGPADAMSSIPAGPGGGNIDGFAKGDNCGRPSGSGGAAPGIGEGATPGQKEFVPPESLKNDPEFQAKLNEMKGKYPGLTDQQIYNVIGGESGFNFKAVNGQSGATGAFQFIPSTASSLGYSTSQIQGMTPAQQLGVYDKYLSTNGYKGGALGIMQAAPAYASKPSNFEVYPVGSKAWAQNPGWRGSDGKITVASINRYYGY